MKICILALPRTSSTSLFFVLRTLCKVNKNIFEPFNKHIYNDKNKEKNYNDISYNDDDILVKLIYSEYCLPENIENLEEFLLWVKNTFTHVICLYREDCQSQSESLCYHLSMNNNFNWQNPKIIDLRNIDLNFIENIRKELMSLNKILIDFANKNNFPIFKYESLILNEGNNESFKEICNYLNVNFDYDFIYQSYRKEKKVSLKRNKNNTKLI